MEPSAITSMRRAAAATIFSRRMRGAAALDQAKFIVDLVGAVDREIELGHLVEGGERECPRAVASVRVASEVGTPTTFEAGAHALAQRRDEERRRRARADAEAHAVGDEASARVRLRRV